MNQRVPTYLQYDESTYTDISFTSTLDDTFQELEPVPKSTVPAHTPPPRRPKVLLERAMKNSMILTKRSIHLSSILSQKAVGVSKIFLLQTRGYFVRKTKQVKNYLQRKKIENELKSFGSFRTKKGFVEIGSEDKCMDQYDIDSCCHSYSNSSYK